MRIGFSCPATYALHGPGAGVRDQAVAQARALRRAGHEVILLNPWDDYPGGLDLVEFFLGGFPHFWIEQKRPHPVPMLVWAPIIDSNEPNWKYRLAMKLGRLIPKVYTIPGMFRDQAMGSDLVVVRSRHEYDRVTQGLEVPASKVEIVLNGMDPPPPTSPDLAHAALGSTGPFVLHVSAYSSPRKNVLNLVRAVGPTGLPLVIAGTAFPGPDLDAIRAAAAPFPNVRLMGFLDRPTLDSMYAACRVFALPSVHEGTGMVALDAAAHGAAVVITRHGGPPDYFRQFAEYVEPASVDDIRAAVVRAFEKGPDPALRRHVHENLTWDASAARLAECYRKHAPR
ncbi:MAG: glycosyltransferase family 4 protein [Phycisphaerales bacterium]|nr:glycosyltransferase family 4 protein [Phycisphaerales bacterium]